MKSSTPLIGVVVSDLLLVVAPHLVTEVVVLAPRVRVHLPFLGGGQDGRQKQSEYYTNRAGLLRRRTLPKISYKLEKICCVVRCYRNRKKLEQICCIVQHFEGKK